MDSYRRRVVDSELDELLPALSALSLDGPKGAGKTATASRRARTVLRFYDRATAEAFEASAQPLAALPAGTVVIDEWQRVPSSWDLVRRAVDDGAEPASFLLTGSASPDGTGLHSGAGRIPTIRMRSLALGERLDEAPSVSLAELTKGNRPSLAGETSFGLDDYVGEILASGLPGLRSISNRALRLQLDGYITRIVDRDFPELGHSVRNPSGLRRCCLLYAAATSTTT